jgi:hypothetical protein
MSNGAKVGDWIGTAGSAAASSSRAADQAREATDPAYQSYYIATALEYARQAVEDLQAAYNATHA